MSSRARLLVIVIAVCAGLAVLGRQLVVSTTDAGMRAGDVVVIERQPLRDSELVIDDAAVDPPVRSALAPQHTQIAALATNPAELFPNVISGTVVVSGRPPGAAAGARVSCTPSLGSVVDCTVDARDHFEARGIPAGRVVLTCKLEGHWAADTTVVVEDSVPTESVAITLRRLRSLEIWIDDAQGRPIPCDEENVPLLQRLSPQLVTGPERIGAETDKSLLSRDQVSTHSSPALIALQFSDSERPVAAPFPEFWSTLEFLEFPGAHLSLTLGNRVVDSVPIPGHASEIHLRFDPLPVTGSFTQLDIDVVEEETLEPVADIEVLVGEYGVTMIPMRVRTNSSGRAQLLYLPPWDYHVTARGGDYLTTSVRASVQAGTASCSARLVVKRGTSIEGRVELSAEGDRWSPRIGQVLCRAILDSGSPRYEGLGTSARQSLSGSDRFEFKGLAPGRYAVELYVSSDPAKNPRIEVDTRGGSVRGLVLREP